MTNELRQNVRDILKQLGHDELCVVHLIASRLLAGQSQYGKLDLATDARDWLIECRDEWADAAVYGALKMLTDSVRRARPVVNEETKGETT